MNTASFSKLSFDDFEQLASTPNSQLEPVEAFTHSSKFKSFDEILRVHDICLNQICQEESKLNDRLEQIEYECKLNNTCDKWDYIMAASIGVLAGLVDAFLVGDPKNSVLRDSVDSAVDGCVKRFASLLGWKGTKGDSDEMSSAIAYLERMFPVNYDQRYITNLPMSSKNHHLMSLSHSPSPIGLIFSIINQFTSTSTFISDGRIITIDTEHYELRGGNIPAKIFCGFVNWFGHIMSDVAGSSGAKGRGTGVPIPFYELTQFLNVGEFGADKLSFAQVARKVFEEGYDLRFGLVMSIPVVIVELVLRVYCVIRDRYGCSTWSERLKRNLGGKQTLRMQKMLLVAQGSLCLVDLTDATIRSGGMGANPVLFFSRLNCIAWARFSYLALKVAYRLLSNDINKARYQLRAEAYDDYVKEVRAIVKDFDRKYGALIEEFFKERHEELEKLFYSLEANIQAQNYLAANEDVVKIGKKYGHKRKMMSFKDFNNMIDEDDYD